MNKIPKDCKGALIARVGGPYLPWGEEVTPETLKCWRCELFEVVDELAKLERWPDDLFDHIAYCVERQPLSTLRPDLAHFRRRLTEAKAEVAAREAANRRPWRFDQ
jgi:hypothetical protein